MVCEYTMAYSFYAYANDFADADCIVREVDTMDIGERDSVVVEVDNYIKVFFHYKTRTDNGESLVASLHRERYGKVSVIIELDDRTAHLHWCRVPSSKKTRKH